MEHNFGFQRMLTTKLSTPRCSNCRMLCGSVLEKMMHEKDCKSSGRLSPLLSQMSLRRTVRDPEDDFMSLVRSRMSLDMPLSSDSDNDDDDNDDDDNDDDDNDDTCLPMVGMRVVRGPSWKWKNQDEGEGSLGTVIEYNPTTKWVDVLWDHGAKANYRGGNGANDLLVLDSAPAGIKHPKVLCDVCNKFGGDVVIRGTRWKCKQCHDFDLCTTCYMGNKHDLNHQFIRFDKKDSSGILVPPRSKSRERLQSKGLCPGATVTRGRDWKWEKQDGGRGKKGTIVKMVSGFTDDVVKDGASVQWDKNKMKNNYRAGSKGKVDLIAIKPGNGMAYYKEHLALCGVKMYVRRFSIGDPVRVVMHPAAMEKIQKGHGGWFQHMTNLIGEPGTVEGFESNNDVLVRYQYDILGSGKDCNLRFNPAALEKLESEDPEYVEPKQIVLCNDSSEDEEDCFETEPVSSQLDMNEASHSTASRHAEGNIHRLLHHSNLLIDPQAHPQTSQQGPSTQPDIVTPAEKVNIMISYSWQHKDIPRQLAEQLETLGYEIWIDTKKMHGNLYQEIGTAVKEAHVVLLCMSDSYNESEICQKEACLAADLRKPVIPIKVQNDVEPKGWLAIITAGKLYIDFTADEFDHNVQKLIHEINEV